MRFSSCFSRSTAHNAAATMFVNVKNIPIIGISSKFNATIPKLQCFVRYLANQMEKKWKKKNMQ